MAWHDFVRVLFRRDFKLLEFLERQAVHAHNASQALARFGAGVSATEVCKAVQEQEHLADKLVHELEEALARSFLTPIDRKDMYALSLQLDDVTDSTNKTARACELLGVDVPSTTMSEMADLLVKATAEVAAAVPRLRARDYQGIFAAKARIRGFEKEADRVHRNAVSGLFKAPGIDIKVLLREREVLDELESAIDHCERVADTLSNLAAKHG